LTRWTYATPACVDARTDQDIDQTVVIIEPSRIRLHRPR
jgi:hypothetical protein